MTLYKAGSEVIGRALADAREGESVRVALIADQDTAVLDLSATPSEVCQQLVEWVEKDNEGEATAWRDLMRIIIEAKAAHDREPERHGAAVAVVAAELADGTGGPEHVQQAERIVSALEGI